MKKKYFNMILTVVLLLGLAAGLYALLKFFRPFGFGPWELKEKILDVFYRPVVELFQYTIFTLWFWVALGITLLMERLLPAKQNQKILSLSFLQDLVWFFYETILHALVIATYVAFLMWGYEAYFSWMTITAVESFPGWIKFIFALLLLDLMYWLQHFLNHKIPFMWEFHKVHHSQTELNFFTDFRYHVIEYLVRHTFLVIPFMIFTVTPPVIVAFAIVQKWYTRFYHGNIRTDLGPLRYILVTPQSHRVHHSCRKEHYDKNFGSLFSIWDFLFRTQHMGFDEYPETGVPDNAFPLEKSTNVRDLLLTPWRQLIYPFQSIYRKWFKRPPAAGGGV